MRVDVTEEDMSRAIANATRSAMAAVMSNFADTDSLQDCKFVRYERLGRYLSSCRDSLLKAFEEQETKAQRIMLNIEQETPDIFTFSPGGEETRKERIGYNMDYRTLQNTTVDRHMGGISAHRILEILQKENNNGYILICGCSPRISGGRLKVETGHKDFRPGDYIDLKLSYTVYNGAIDSYNALIIGKTPSQFVPQDCRD